MEDDGDERSPAAWVALGVMAIFVVVVPLAMLVFAALRALPFSPSAGAGLALTVILSALTPAISSAAGGWLVGRFGPDDRGRVAALAGLGAGLVMWALSRTPMGFVIVLVTTPAAWMVGRIGARGRPRRAQTP